MLMRRWVLIWLAIVMTMGVWSAFFEDRAYCAIVDGQVRVSLDESQGRLCREYRDRVVAVQQKLRDDMRTVRWYIEQSNSPDYVYWSNIQKSYQQQYDSLGIFDQSIVDALEQFDMLVLVQVQRHLSEQFAIEALRCTNMWPQFRVRYTASRYPLCRMGQEQHIQNLQQSTDLDEYVELLKAYVDRQERVLKNWF